MDMMAKWRNGYIVKLRNDSLAPSLIAFCFSLFTLHFSLFTFSLAAEPTLKILSPKNEEVIEATSVEVRLKVENFTLDKENIGGAKIEGHGHAHILVDGKFTGEVLDDVAITTDTYLLTNLTAGVHKITVLLHNNDHSPTVPYYSDSINIVVQEAETTPTARNNLLLYAAIAVLVLGGGAFAVFRFRKGL